MWVSWGKSSPKKRLPRWTNCFKKIWDKLRGNPRAEKALQEIEKGSKDHLNKLAVYLEDEMKDNPDFAAQVSTLAQEIKAGKIEINSQNIQQNYDNSTGFQNDIDGGENYIAHTINIHKP